MLPKANRFFSKKEKDLSSDEWGAEALHLGKPSRCSYSEHASHFSFDTL
jgi:hypothetical protein